jgi:hypothetical protein
MTSGDSEVHEQWKLWETKYRLAWLLRNMLNMLNVPKQGSELKSSYVGDSASLHMFKVGHY